MGALTSKPYAFTARPWELSEREAFDIFDPFGSSVKLNLRGKEVMRVLPNVRFSLGEEWISDSSRFSYDSILGESRMRTAVMPLGGVGLGNQVCFSSAWFSDFLGPRLAITFMPDHFCLSYVNTVQFFHHFFGFSGFLGHASTYDTRFFPYSQLNSFYSSLAGGISNLFFFDLNMRYTFPTASIKVRQIVFGGKFNITVFNLSATVNNLLNETNVSCGPKSLVNTLRFKSRISRLLVSASSYSLFGFDTFTFFRDYVSKYVPGYSVFHRTPAVVSFSELGLTGRLAVSYSSSLSDSGFLSATLSTNHITKAAAFPFDVNLPLLHPYEDFYSYYLKGKSVTYSPSVSFVGGSAYTVRYPFLFKLSYYSTFTPSEFLINLYFANKVYSKLSDNFSNYITHFLYNQFQQGSINILLNVKRHNEFRSNYIYYLRSC